MMHPQKLRNARRIAQEDVKYFAHEPGELRKDVPGWMLHARCEVIVELLDHIAERERLLVEAIRLTVEYVGLDTLPAVVGWSWYDALMEVAPEVVRSMTDERLEQSPPEIGEAVMERQRFPGGTGPE